MVHELRWKSVHSSWNGKARGKESNMCCFLPSLNTPALQLFKKTTHNRFHFGAKKRLKLISSYCQNEERKGGKVMLLGRRGRRKNPPNPLLFWNDFWILPSMEKYSQSYCPFNLIYLFYKPNMFGMLYFQKTSSTLFSVKMLTVQWKQIDVNMNPINTVILD